MNADGYYWLPPPCNDGECMEWCCMLEDKVVGYVILTRAKLWVPCNANYVHSGPPNKSLRRSKQYLVQQHMAERIRTVAIAVGMLK